MRLLFRFLPVVCVALSVAGCDKSEIAREVAAVIGPTATITITPRTVSLEPGEQISVSAIVTGASGGTTPVVTWQSLEREIATVAAYDNRSAIITGVSAGTATVLVSIGDMRTFERVTVTVRAPVAAGPPTPPPPPAQPVNGTLQWQESRLLEFAVQASRSGLDFTGLRAPMNPQPPTANCPRGTMNFSGPHMAMASLAGTGRFVQGIDALITGRAPIDIGTYLMMYEFEARVRGRVLEVWTRIYHPELAALGCAAWTGTMSIPD